MEINYQVLQMPFEVMCGKGVSDVKFKDYNCMYDNKIDLSGDKWDNITICDYLFEKFNINHPDPYMGRSMSVGDVIVIDRDNECKYYLCCMVGWKELDNFVTD